MGLYLLATCLSAFLLFQVQPVMARLILPTFGGGPSVWSACLSFFQAALLLGYLYAHLQVRYLSPKHQAITHCGILLLSIALLPIGVNVTPGMLDGTGPALSILILLSLSIGIPFVLLAASAPLLQHWYGSVFRLKSPYRLYALSNAGSLLALISYPVLIEPAITLGTQVTTWSVLYAMLVVAFGGCGLLYIKARGTDNRNHPALKENSNANKASLTDKVMWMALAACGTVLLLSVTNQISQNIAVVPFLWILPLSLYLLSYILCFARDSWYRRVIWWPVALLSLCLLLVDLHTNVEIQQTSLAWQITVLCSTLFAGCMICHGELVRRRAAVDGLTTFYLYVACGGAVGGGFVNFLAPALFNGFWELHLSLLGFVMLAAICWIFDGSRPLSDRRSIMISALSASLVLGLAVSLVDLAMKSDSHSIHVTRSFFGVIQVREQHKGETGHIRNLYHGKVSHGLQVMRPDRRVLATAYYGEKSGLGVSLQHHPNRRAQDAASRNLKIGVIGLGTGSTAALTQSGDRLRFYEIDPAVKTVAQEYFHFLELDRAKIEVVLGDARVRLQQELESLGSHQFDVLAVDAFSSDSIPVHLLTAEAFELYRHHLAADGVLALHITNLYVDLLPVVYAAAEQQGMSAILVKDRGKRWFEYKSEWILMSGKHEIIESLATLKSAGPLPLEAAASKVLWTDDFSNLFELLNWRG